MKLVTLWLCAWIILPATALLGFVALGVSLWQISPHLFTLITSLISIACALQLWPGALDALDSERRRNRRLRRIKNQ